LNNLIKPSDLEKFLFGTRVALSIDKCLTKKGEQPELGKTAPEKYFFRIF